MVKVHSWGRLGEFDHQMIPLSDRHRIAPQLRFETAGLAYGMGRSYGDVCLNPGGVLWNTTTLDRFIRFDESSGLLQCEAGLLLRDVQRLIVPRGWMLPVVPGTQLATLGGAVANDVHGKNHHVAGSFGDHVIEIVLMRIAGMKNTAAAISTCEHNLNNMVTKATGDMMVLAMYIIGDSTTQRRQLRTRHDRQHPTARHDHSLYITQQEARFTLQKTACFVKSDEAIEHRGVPQHATGIEAYIAIAATHAKCEAKSEARRFRSHLRCNAI